jgi:phenylpropionate dioxygenase-like ring-hydroxylating dioxygenase large terminal subunit
MTGLPQLPADEAAFEHWQPVLLAKALKRKPVGVTLLGQRITLFRTESGTIGAVDSRCAHRHMDLSHGRVQGEQLVCPMHGWTYDAQGTMTNPQGRVHATHRHRCWEAAQKYRMIWLRRGGPARPLPSFRFEDDGFELASVGAYPMRASLAKTMDHFLEVEHTPMVHVTLGFDMQRELEVTTSYEERRIVTLYRGTQMRMKSLVRHFIHGKAGDIFVDRFTTAFEPLHTTYEHHWLDPATQRRKLDKRVYVTFFTPNDRLHTTCFTIAFYHDFLMDLPWLGPVFRRLYRWLITPINKHYMNVEMTRDQKIIDKLHERDDRLDEMLLDAAKDQEMVMRRRYVDRWFYGRTGSDA